MSKCFNPYQSFLKLIFALLMPILCTTYSYAQNSVMVTGTVTDDETKKPLPNVSVVLKGSTTGVITNENGKYTISVPVGSVLEFTYLKSTPEQVIVSKGGNYNVSLSSITKLNNELVLIGYGTAKRKNVVGAVDVINPKTTGQNSVTNAEQLLIGKSAGVQILNSSGVPGSNTQIIIRGTGSFTDVTPLYVIDGIQGFVNVVSPQDIESITILKDASSTAIYGSAAANGVVIITTKKAKAGPPKITFSSKIGIAKAWRKLDLLKTKDYVDLVKDIAETNGQTLQSKFTDGSLHDSTDWQKEVLRTGLISENFINLNGGTDKVLYNLSVGYITQQAIVKDYQNNRGYIRMGLEENIGRFHFGQDLDIRFIRDRGQLGSLADAATYAPYKPIYDKNITGGYSTVTNEDDNSIANNPLQILGVRKQRTDEYLYYPLLFGEVRLMKGLKFRSQVAITIGGGTYQSFNWPYESSNYSYNDRLADEYFFKFNLYNLENYFSYNRSFGKHDFSATLGNSYFDAGDYTDMYAVGTNIPNNNIPYISGALSQTVGGVVNSYATQYGSLISYYGRLVYTYNNRYIFSASVRRDGSSNFGANNRFGNFPGIGVAWKFSEEDFIKKNLPFINEGKLRFGWGRTGNNKIELFLTDATTYSGASPGNLVYSLGSPEQFYSGTTINSFPNPNLKWEQTDQTDLGLELNMFKNKLSIGIDWYKRKSTGLLINVPLPPSNGIGGVGGYGSSLVSNAADAENKGLEISIGYRVVNRKNLNYGVSVNGAFNRNKVTSLGNQFEAGIKDGAFNGLYPITYTAAGYPIGSYYGYNVDHVATDQAEIDALNASAPGGIYQEGLLPGDFIFKDLNGDKTVTKDDQKVLGNPMPKFVYGINGNLSYKNFDLNLVISGISGLKLVNASKFYTHNGSPNGNASTAILNRWRKPGDVAALPRAGQSQTADGNLRPSDFFIENGAYMRVRNLTFGYNVPAEKLARFTGKVLSSLRVYLSAENLLTITKYEGYDPEVSTQNGRRGPAFVFRRGIDNFQLPQPRTFIAGVQLGF